MADSEAPGTPSVSTPAASGGKKKAVRRPRKKKGEAEAGAVAVAVPGGGAAGKGEEAEKEKEKEKGKEGEEGGEKDKGEEQGENAVKEKEAKEKEVKKEKPLKEKGKKKGVKRAAGEDGGTPSTKVSCAVISLLCPACACVRGSLRAMRFRVRLWLGIEQVRRKRSTSGEQRESESWTARLTGFSICLEGAANNAKPTHALRTRPCSHTTY